MIYPIKIFLNLIKGIDLNVIIQMKYSAFTYIYYMTVIYSVGILGITYDQPWDVYLIGRSSSRPNLRQCNITPVSDYDQGECIIDYFKLYILCHWQRRIFSLMGKLRSLREDNTTKRRLHKKTNQLKRAETNGSLHVFPERFVNMNKLISLNKSVF